MAAETWLSPAHEILFHTYTADLHVLNIYSQLLILILIANPSKYSDHSPCLLQRVDNTPRKAAHLWLFIFSWPLLLCSS